MYKIKYINFKALTWNAFFSAKYKKEQIIHIGNKMCAEQNIT